MFNSSAIPSAGTIDQTNAHTAAKLAKHDDGAAICTRVHARGGGAGAASDAAIGQDTLPIVDPAWYSATGGLVECGPQRLSYTGIVGASEGGSTLGTIQAPPLDSYWTFNLNIPGGGTYLPAGTYDVGFSNVTNAGETVASTRSFTVSDNLHTIVAWLIAIPSDPAIKGYRPYISATNGGPASCGSTDETPAIRDYTTEGVAAMTEFSYVPPNNSLHPPAPTVSTAGESSLTIPAGSTALAVEELAPFPASGWAEAPGGQLLRYTGRSAASGPGTLTGIPASGIGAITAPIRSGTIRSIPHLIGIPASGAGAIVYPIKRGDEVYIFLIRDDAAAIAALAAATGGDGIRIEFLTDGRLGLAELTARADALLTMRKQALVTVNFETRDPAVTVGKTITFNTTAPPIVGTFLIQRVQLSQFPARGSLASTPPLRVVEASSRRYTFDDLVQQIKLLGRIN